MFGKEQGYRTVTILESFHGVLHADFTFHIFYPALKLTSILAAGDESALRFISMYFQELHFKKDAEIIRCNDIKNNIYIVMKGRVDIYVAKDRLSTLTTGGMFGCFLPNGNTRQTINVQAKVNVDVLVINNETFNNIISGYPKIKEKMKTERLLNAEYLLPIDTVKSYGTSEGSLPHSYSLSTVQNLERIKSFLINPNNTYYMIYDYLTNIHFATLSSLLTMTFIVIKSEPQMKKYVSIYIYLTDAYFLSKILAGFSVTYVDSESGMLVSNYHKVWKRYVKSFTGLWLDLATCAPIELIGLLFTNDVKTLNFLLTNRTMRFIFMVKYYTIIKNTLTVSKHLRWTYLMYLMVLLIHINVCVWWLIACPEMVCSYIKNLSLETIDASFEKENDTISSFRLAYLHVINVFTSTSLKVVVPRTKLEMVTTVIMICIAQYTLIALTAGFASMLVLEKSVMIFFERRAGHVLKYMESINLSLSLRNKIWDYYIMLWTKSHGEWLPKLITTAPSYLKEDIMLELYGRHLFNHFLFKKTHIDFLRQLIVQLELCIFLPGMYITQKGDIDNSMYFIEDGEVIVYDKDGRNEIEQLVLGPSKSFGELQCLYSLPHEKSYKARFTSTILILNKDNWRFLLKWFPASKEQLEQEAARRFRMHSVSATC